jgi:hypothetical protein
LKDGTGGTEIDLPKMAEEGFARGRYAIECVDLEAG